MKFMYTKEDLVRLVSFSEYSTDVEVIDVEDCSDVVILRIKQWPELAIPVQLNTAGTSAKICFENFLPGINPSENSVPYEDFSVVCGCNSCWNDFRMFAIAYTCMEHGFTEIVLHRCDWAYKIKVHRADEFSWNFKKEFGCEEHDRIFRVFSIS